MLRAFGFRVWGSGSLVFGRLGHKKLIRVRSCEFTALGFYGFEVKGSGFGYGFGVGFGV